MADAARTSGSPNPYQLNDAQFEAAVALLEQQRDNGALYWAHVQRPDRLVRRRRRRRRDDLAVPGQPDAGREAARSPGVLPGRGLDRLVGHLDDRQRKAKHPNCMYMWMDHMASAEANGQATVWFGEAPTSQAACDYAETLSPGPLRTDPRDRRGVLRARSGTGPRRRPTAPTPTRPRPARTRTPGSRPGPTLRGA